MAALGKFIPDFENELSSLKYQAVSGFFYVINWYFIFQGKSYFEMTDRPPLFGHLWSLSIEEQFYLIWPLLLIFVLKFGRNKRILAVVSCSIIAISSIILMIAKGQASPDDARAYFGTDTRIYSLMIGSILALVFDQVKKLANSGVFLKSIFEILGAISLFAIFYLSFTLTGGELWVFRGGLLSASIATVFIIVSATCIQSPFSKVLFESAFVRWIGQRSYGLYLWHWPIFILTEPRYNYQIEGVGLLFIRLITLIAITEISFRFVEKPFRSGAIGKIVDEIRKERGNKRRRLIAKAVIPLLTIVGLVGFCSVSVLNFQSKGIPGLAQAMASGTEKVESVSIPKVSQLPADNQKLIDVNLIQENTANKSSKENSGVIQEEDADEVLAIGDSVMLGAKTALEDSMDNLTVNAAVSRQFSEIHRIIRRLKKTGELPPFVIIHGGTNGTIDEEEFIDMMNDLSECRRVVVFNLRVPKKWQDSNNKIIDSIVPNYKNAVLVDWHKESSGQRKIFYKDGVHLKHPEGIMLYAQLAKQALTEQ
jgi:peptidoglycan/LPS O-acetylase OafA/YrhL